ncbi:MAG: hypothetical protein KBT03_11055 [Bacteroidales bacterium]|nr:hypothetical protein [Candidatus Scybalousia scybalohippi]
MSELRKVKEFFHCGRKVKFLYHNGKLVVYDKPWNNYIKDGLIFQLDAFDPKSITEILGIPDDAATYNLGNEWRTPSKADWQELVDNCEVTTYYTYDHRTCYKFTGSTGNCIYFVVDNGYKTGAERINNYGCAMYMTNELFIAWPETKYVSVAYIGGNAPLFPTEDDEEWWIYPEKYYGYHIRAVSATQGVDLGLPSGTKWAASDIGATSYEKEGMYFAFGEVDEKSRYDKSNYKYFRNGKYVKYNNEDGLLTLTPSRFTYWTDMVGGKQCVSQIGVMQQNKGIVFDGKDYLSVPEFWEDGQYVEIVFQPEGENNSFTLFSNSTSEDIGARVWRVGQYDYKFGGHEYLSNSNITLEELQIVSCTIKKDYGPTMKPYDNSYFVNGVDVGRGDTWGGNAKPLSIGNGLKGIIKSIRVYDHLLSEEERQANYKIDLMRFSNL